MTAVWFVSDGVMFFGFSARGNVFLAGLVTAGHSSVAHDITRYQEPGALALMASTLSTSDDAPMQR
jgi:hypothetical protein